MKTNNMKIVKREFISLGGTINIWLIPTTCYLLQKMVGIVIPSREWIWLVGILLTVLIWLGINFKIVKNK
jgi:hypothetical protein